MRAALALLLHAGAVLSARHEFGRTCELHDLDERPTGLWRVFPDLRWLWAGPPRDNDGWEELDMASLASGELRLKSEV